MKILIDPGHGGQELGATYKDLKEKDLNLTVALKLKNLLEKNEFEVFLTRFEDRELTLRDRVELVNKINPDIFLSIHHNSAYENIKNQIEVYYRWEKNGPSKKFSEILTKTLEKFLDLPSRKPFPAFYTVLRNSAKVSVLVEPYYLKFYNPDLPEITAVAIESAIKHFYEISYPQIKEIQIENNAIIFQIEGDFDIQKSLAKIENETLFMEKNEKQAIIYITRSGNLSVIFRNYFGFPSDSYEIKVNNIFKTYNLEIFPGYKNMPNIITIRFYDIFFEPISDGFEVEIEINGTKSTFKTQNGKISFVAEIMDKAYEIKIKILNQEFIENIELLDKKMYWAKFNFKEGIAISSNKRVFKISGGYLFSNERKLKVISRGFKSQEVDLETSNYFEFEKLYGGLLIERKIVIFYEYIEGSAYELFNWLYLCGAKAIIEEIDSELSAIKKAVEFNSEILIYLKYSSSKKIKFYEMDNYGKKLAQFISNYLKLPIEFSSYQILIQPFGARVLIETEELQSKEIMELTRAIVDYLKGISTS